MTSFVEPMDTAEPPADIYAAAAAAAVAEWSTWCEGKACHDKFAGAGAAEHMEDLCSTAVPSPSLVAERCIVHGGRTGSWTSQDLDTFESFVLADEAAHEDYSGMQMCAEFAPGFVPAGAEELAAWDYEGQVCCDQLPLEMPPGLQGEAADVNQAEFHMQYLLEAQAFEAQAFEGVAVEEYVHAPPWEVVGDCACAGAELLSSMQPMDEGVMAPPGAGHAETGERAWRIAPRPSGIGLEFDAFEPLAVRPGMAPDGYALLEAATGLEGGSDGSAVEAPAKVDDEHTRCSWRSADGGSNTTAAPGVNSAGSQAW